MAKTLAGCESRSSPGRNCAGRVMRQLDQNWSGLKVGLLLGEPLGLFSETIGLAFTVPRIEKEIGLHSSEGLSDGHSSGLHNLS